MAAASLKRPRRPLVYLGFKDERILPEHLKGVDFSTSKIGGQPDWIALPPPTYRQSNCGSCSGPTLLIAQLYAPLDGGSDQHRTLYVFACPQPDCFQDSRSWKCFRAQMAADPSWSSGKRAVAAASTKPTPSLKVTDWMEDADDWGSGEEEEEYDDDEEMDELNGNAIGRQAESMMERLALTTSPAPSSSSSSEGRSPSGAVSLSHQVPNIATAEIETDHDPDMDRLVTVEPPRELVDGSQILSLMFGGKQHHQKNRNVVVSSKVSISHLTPFFVAVEAGPDDDDDDDVGQQALTDHERELLLEYKSRESATAAAAAEESQDGYEKCPPAHGDAYFHKLASVMRRNPGQIIRYCRDLNHVPLFASRPGPNDVPTRCRHCQGPLVCEVQLLPSLITCLQLSKEERERLDCGAVGGRSSSLLEFGTVLVYTCFRSCGKSGHYLEESIVLQAEEAF